MKQHYSNNKATYHAIFDDEVLFYNHVVKKGNIIT